MVTSIQNAVRKGLGVDILIPFFNKGELVVSCLKSLERCASRQSRVTLVDDGSGSEARDQVESHLMAANLDARLVSHSSNRGYKEAINSGMKHCDREYVILLNNDTIPTPGFDLKLIEVMEDDPTIRAVAPVSNHPTDLYQYREHLAHIRPSKGADSLEIQAEFEASQPDQGRRVTTAPYLTGMCLALDRRMFNKAELFAGAYQHGYFEDLALSCEIRDQSFRLGIREDCFVFHQGHATYRDKSQDEKYRIVMHNFEIFQSDWGHLPEHGDLVKRMDFAGKHDPL